jgi:hypothetical protein
MMGVVLADQQFQWFYWIAVLLALGLVPMLLGMTAGYIRKVIIPKYRGKRVVE